MSDGKARGCFKVGCIGCLTVIALAVGLVFLFGALQLSTDFGDPQPETADVSRPLPAVPDLPPLPSEATAEELGGIAVAPLPASFQPAEVAGGRVVLDLRMGNFTIVPGAPGEPIRVEADYDANAFELTETYTAHDDAGWTYEVGFDSKGGFFGMLMRGGVQSGENRVTITIPRDHPVSIVGKIGMGESEIDLGGLWVRDVDLELGTGDHFVEFREPLRFPMDRFKIDSSMGNMEIRGLGAASPAQVDVDHSMGELFVDLEGSWQNDAAIKVRFGMGQCRLWLPEDVRIDVDRAKVSMGERRLDFERDPAGLPASAPTLHLDLRGSMGELRVER